MGKGNSIRAGKAFYELGGLTNPLAIALKKAERMVMGSVTKASSLVKGIAGKLLSIKGLMTGVFAGTGLGLPAKMFAAMGTELTDLSRLTLTSQAALSSLGYAAKLTGTDLASVGGLINTVREKMIEAARGSEEAQLAFYRLGINFLSLSRLRPEQQLRLIADRLKQIPNPAIRAAVAAELLGSADMVPFLMHMKEGEARAKRLGLIMSTQTAEGAKQFDMAITDVWESLKMLGVEMGAKSAPLIQELADKVLDYIKAAREWVAANGGIRDSAKAMWAELKNLWTQGKDFLAGVWDEVTAKANGVWIDVRAEAEKAWLTIKSVASSALKSITEFAADVRNGLEEWKGPLLEIRDMLKEVMGFAKMLAGHIGDVNTALDKINNFNPSWLVIRGAGNLLGVGPNPVFPKAAAGNLPAGGGGLARPLPMKPAGAAGMLDDPLLNHKLAMIDGMKNIDKAKLGPAPAGGGWGNFANKAKGVIGGFIGNIRDAAAKGVAGAKANANNAPDKKKADDLHNNAGAGIGSAIHNLRGIGAHDVRTVEGFSEAARGLQQQQAYALAQREFIETRRIREALEKLGLVG